MLSGAQKPTTVHAPKGKSGDAEDAAFLSAAYGLKPDEWQRNVLDAWMQRKGGKWAAGRWGIAVPRQNGKNGVLEIVELYFMVALGLKILHTAHEVKTARKAFLRIASFFENERKYPELAGMVKAIRKTNGQEAILLHSTDCDGGCGSTCGGSVEFIARSKGSGRGFTVDVLVCDEAQEYSEDAQAALLPTISSAPSGDPLQILLGTPPAPNMDGAVFTRMRSAGVEGTDKRLAWVEWSASGDVDVTDKSLWERTNPSLGGRLGASVVEDECAAMDADVFARERLGMWAADSQLAVIPGDVWAAREVDTVPDVPVSAIGVDMAPDAARVSVAVGLKVDSGVHVELADVTAVADSTDLLVQWLTKRAGRRVPVLIDAMSPARLLVPALKAARVKVIIMSGGEVMESTAGFYQAAHEGTLTHYGQAQLAESLAGARRKPMGDAGGWKWNRKTLNIDLTPIVSATFAHYGVVKFGAKRERPKSGGVTFI